MYVYFSFKFGAIRVKQPLNISLFLRNLFHMFWFFNVVGFIGSYCTLINVCSKYFLGYSFFVLFLIRYPSSWFKWSVFPLYMLI